MVTFIPTSNLPFSTVVVALRPKGSKSISNSNAVVWGKKNASNSCRIAVCCRIFFCGRASSCCIFASPRALLHYFWHTARSPTATLKFPTVHSASRRPPRHIEIQSILPPLGWFLTGSGATRPVSAVPFSCRGWRRLLRDLDRMLLRSDPSPPSPQSPWMLPPPARPGRVDCYWNLASWKLSAVDRFGAEQRKRAICCGRSRMPIDFVCLL